MLTALLIIALFYAGEIALFRPIAIKEAALLDSAAKAAVDTPIRVQLAGHQYMIPLGYVELPTEDARAPAPIRGMSPALKGAARFYKEPWVLRSFGFWMEYPTMRRISLPEFSRQEQAGKHESVMFIGVEAYGATKNVLTIERARVLAGRAGARYEEKAAEYGLRRLTPGHVDDALDAPPTREARRPEFYYTLSPSAEVATWIECSNAPEAVDRQLCMHRAYLYGSANHYPIEITLQYRRPQLANWQAIESSIRRRLINVELKPEWL